MGEDRVKDGTVISSVCRGGQERTFMFFGPVKILLSRKVMLEYTRKKYFPRVI